MVDLSDTATGIDIRQQGGALQVQLSATHDEVRQQLRQIAEPLRHDLVQRHTGDVSVQVASGAPASGDGRGRDGATGGQLQRRRRVHFPGPLSIAYVAPRAHSHPAPELSSSTNGLMSRKFTDPSPLQSPFMMLQPGYAW